MKAIFDKHATPKDQVARAVKECLGRVSTLEAEQDTPIIIFQDGVKGSYYVKCSMPAAEAANLCDLSARLDLSTEETFRANRELLLQHATYVKMEEDAAAGREFNDLIVEYSTQYDPETPLKVWGGQHRISAIRKAGVEHNRYHGFRIYFALTKEQRTEVALISNTNISVSNDTFDRMIEETIYGDKLRQWCWEVGLLEEGENFPDSSRSERITVKLARSFVVNFYLGKKRGEALAPEELDTNVYEPQVAKTGVTIDSQYRSIMKEPDILEDEALVEAGKRFAALHRAQRRAVESEGSTVTNLKSYRNKAFVLSVLCGWSHVAGVLQSHPDRLTNHYRIPRTTSSVPDPLNAEEMSKFKHSSDPPTYRGIGTRSSLKERQRTAQLFLAKSRRDNVVLDRRLMNRAVSQVVGLLALAEGYT